MNICEEQQSLSDSLSPPSSAPSSPPSTPPTTLRNSTDTHSDKKTKVSFKNGDLVKLNIGSSSTSSKSLIKLTLIKGGEIFLTTWDTLTKEKNSMLSAMFAGRIPVQLLEDNSVFIDRDGKHFARILNYLRNGDIEPPKDRSTVFELLHEAEFYQLNSLIFMLKEHIASELGSPVLQHRSAKYTVGKQVLVIKTESEKDLLLKTVTEPIVILEVSSSSFGEEKDAIIYKHLVLFDKLSSDYADKITFVKQIVYTGKEWKFFAKGKLQHSVFFYNQYNGKHSFQEEIILDRILKLILLPDRDKADK